MKYIGIFLLFLISLNVYSQILNVEYERHEEDSIKLFKDLLISYNYQNDNHNPIIDIDANLNLQKRKNKNTFILVGYYDFNKSNSINIINKSYLHFRFDRKIYKKIIFELYTQVQNNFKRDIKLRYLFGSGLRYKLFKNDKNGTYIGTSILFEHKEYYDSAPRHGLRLSNYISSHLKIVNNLNLFLTAYYQPGLTDFQNYMFLFQSKLSFKASKNINIGSSFTYTYDTRPPTTFSNETKSVLMIIEIKM